VHVSVRHPAELYDDASPWGWSPRQGGTHEDTGG
jgi:hypothetical protein